MEKKWLERTFLIGSLLLMVVPFAGMSLFATNETKEKSTLASIPSLQNEQGQINLNYLQNWGTYFNDHFAFKEPLITMNSLLLSSLLQSSNQTKVVLGNQGNLFFLGEIMDYQGLLNYSQRDLFNITQNLKLMQDYIESKGSRFVLTIAPNKSTLYSQDVPARYQAAETSNFEKLEQALKEAGIHYVTLLEPLQELEDPYFKLDTHWNNEGALSAYNTLMKSLGLEPRQYNNEGKLEAHSGDLSDMLFPSLNLTEENRDDSEAFSYTWNEDNSWVQSTNPEGNGILLFYSDSYGDALFPYLSNHFSYAERHTLVPLNLIRLEQMEPTEVIFERAQRRFNFFQESAPIMIMPQVKPLESEAKESDTSLQISLDGGFFYIHGIVNDPEFQDDSRLVLKIRGENGQERFYPVFYIGRTLYDDDGVLQSDLVDEENYALRNHGYALYLPETWIEQGDILSVVMQNDQKAYTLTSIRVTELPGKENQ